MKNIDVTLDHDLEVRVEDHCSGDEGPKKHENQERSVVAEQHRPLQTP